MADLGRFGTARESVEELDTFEFFDTRVRVNPEFGELDFADFLEAAVGISSSGTQAMLLIKKTLRDAVHPDDFDAFWATAKRERQEVTDFLGVLYAVIEAVSGRPTVRPSDSADGPPATSTASQGDSSLRVIRRLEDEGRPSIALMVQQAGQGRASAASA